MMGQHFVDLAEEIVGYYEGDLMKSDYCKGHKILDIVEIEDQQDECVE